MDRCRYPEVMFESKLACSLVPGPSCLKCRLTSSLAAKFMCLMECSLLARECWLSRSLLKRSLINVLEGTDELWNIIVIIVGCRISLTVNASSDLLLKELVLLWSDLLQDIRHHFLEALCLRGARHDQKILPHGERGLWLPEVDDCMVVLEHVHFIDVLQLLHSEFLNGLLEFLVLIDFLMVHDLFCSSLTTYTRSKYNG